MLKTKKILDNRYKNPTMLFLQNVQSTEFSDWCFNDPWQYYLLRFLRFSYLLRLANNLSVAVRNPNKCAVTRQPQQMTIEQTNLTLTLHNHLLFTTYIHWPPVQMSNGYHNHKIIIWKSSNDSLTQKTEITSNIGKHPCVFIDVYSVLSVM